MRTSVLVDRYLVCRRATGIKYESGANHLRRLSRFARDTDGLARGSVEKALLTDGRLTLTSRMRRSTFGLFFRWCVARGFLREMPRLPELPRDLPRRRPHIFSDDEIRRLLSVRHERQDGASGIAAECARTILLLTYALGLRISETLSLKLKDVDTASNVATVRETKFYKTRIVPYNRTIARKLDEFLRWRREAGMPVGPEAPLFARRDGTSVRGGHVRHFFHVLCENAGIATQGGGLHVHDLRHSFAVRRLVSWYREGRDVQALLPKLSVYMGHSSVAGTSVYLSMTPELLSESCARFERYAMGGPRHE